MIVDLNESYANVFTILFRKVIGLIEAQKIVPEGNGLREVRDEIANMRDTRYFGTHGAGILREQLRSKQHHGGEAGQKRCAITVSKHYESSFCKRWRSVEHHAVTWSSTLRRPARLWRVEA